MKNLIFIVLSCNILYATSCKSQQSPVKPKSEKTEEITLTGTFESKRGVMVSLSCYCYNCGYLTTTTGETVAVCITDDNAETNCKGLTFKGKYVTVTKEKDANGVCSGGTMTYFKASSVSCD